MIGIKRPTNGEETRLVDGEEIRPADVKGKD